MAEDAETIETGEAVSIDATATALALAGASRERADAFLGDQQKLIADQRHHLHEQFKRVKMGVVSDRLSIALKLLTALVGVAIAGGLAVMIWDASNSGGLVIEPFAVPPDMAQQGYTGQVVASKLLDRLATMQAETDSQRDPKSFADYWGDDLKVEIPETGVSLGELERFLHETLGHDTRVAGEIVRTAAGLSLSARAAAGGSSTVTGAEADLDPLIRKLADSIFRITEPYRYAVYVREHGNDSEGMATFKLLARTGSPRERAWAYNGLANTAEETDSMAARIALARQALRQMPDLYLPAQNIALSDDVMSMPGEAVRDLAAAAPLLDHPGHGDIRADIVPVAKKRLAAMIDLNLGDFHQSAALWREVAAFGSQGSTFSMQAELVRAEVGEHDLAAARADAVPDPPGASNPGHHALDDVWARLQVDREAGQWARLIADARAAPPLTATYPGLRSFAFGRYPPWLAYAKARLGDFKEADAIIGATPDHCDICLRLRAQIAGLEGQNARADYWIARAVLEQPSIPFAYADWGAALLARDDAQGAIAKFKIANQKGPHFADPLEGWGEALMAQNRSDLGLAKFAEAEKYAPNWGRLHLKWGEALGYAGKPDEAKKQFARAAELDLTPAEKVELARHP